VIVRVGSASDIGRVREGNEDSFLVLAPLYVVADGMGGHRGGEVASSLALQTLQRLSEAREGTLAEQVIEANRAVFERSQEDRSVAGMGTTLTAALVDGDRVHLAHVGDSRAYLFRGGELSMLTEDHTLVHRMVVDGEITEAEAETHPHRSILTRALGVDASVQVDEGDVRSIAGDRILLCSDGLTAMVPDGQIREILSTTADPQEAVDTLVRVANRAGGIDNITAVILDFDEGEVPSPAEVTVVGVPIPEPPEMARSRPRTLKDSRAPARFARGRRVGIGAGIAVTIGVLAFVGLRLYLDSQWFVGVSNGRVAVFRGIPAELGGIGLHSVVVETSIPAEDAQALPFYRELGDGITAPDRQSADAIVQQIRADVTSAQPAGS
jgi:protein phosphatase